MCQVHTVWIPKGYYASFSLAFANVHLFGYGIYLWAWVWEKGQILFQAKRLSWFATYSFRLGLICMWCTCGTVQHTCVFMGFQWSTVPTWATTVSPWHFTASHGAWRWSLEWKNWSPHSQSYLAGAACIIFCIHCKTGMLGNLAINVCFVQSNFQVNIYSLLSWNHTVHLAVIYVSFIFSNFIFDLFL